MSHTVVFKTLRGANFFRFGNEEFVFNFYDGVIGLMGENGLGKSAILDAICICLFNETYRKSTQDDWTNNINGSGLYLSLALETHGASIDKYLITRKPTSRKSAEKLMIYKNDVLLTNLPSYQEFIENTILGFGLNIFKNAVAVSGGTPFISMSPEEKRKFSDNLFSIKQVREYKKKANELLSELQVSKRIIDQEILAATNKITEYRNVVNMATSNTDSQIEAVQIELEETRKGIENAYNVISSANEEIELINEKILSATGEVEALEAKLVELNATAVYTEIGTVTAKLEVCKRDYKNELAEMNRIAPNVICKSCGNFYTEEQASEHRAKHEIEAAKIAELGKLLRNELSTLQESLPTIENIKQAITKIKFTEISGFNNKIHQLKSTISSNSSYINSLTIVQGRHLSRIETLKVQEDQSSVKVFAEQSIIEATALIDKKNIETATIQRKIKALNYIINMCSDTGIKHLLLKEFMPILNKLIAFYLSKFDLPVTVEFDEYFNHNLSAPKGLGQKHYLMSKGQKTRINLAILFAVVDLIKKMGNVKCNLLMLDEFADEGLDPKGFSAAVEAIRKVADRDNKSIVLITHKQEDVLFDNLNALYEVELKNSFSILKEVPSF
jgi:DNA repair exonuclease SbcCD ATPase subunit